jgi:Zn finger protein HypA/HybF involved in hydrogenase expression
MFENSPNDMKFLANVERIAKALERIEQHLDCALIMKQEEPKQTKCTYCGANISPSEVGEWLCDECGSSLKIDPKDPHGTQRR